MSNRQYNTPPRTASFEPEVYNPDELIFVPNIIPTVPIPQLQHRRPRPQYEHHIQQMGQNTGVYHGALAPKFPHCQPNGFLSHQPTSQNQQSMQNLQNSRNQYRRRSMTPIAVITLSSDEDEEDIPPAPFPPKRARIQIEQFPNIRMDQKPEELLPSSSGLQTAELDIVPDDPHVSSVSLMLTTPTLKATVSETVKEVAIHQEAAYVPPEPMESTPVSDERETIVSNQEDSELNSEAPPTTFQEEPPSMIIPDEAGPTVSGNAQVSIAKSEQESQEDSNSSVPITKSLQKAEQDSSECSEPPPILSAQASPEPEESSAQTPSLSVQAPPTRPVVVPQKPVVLPVRKSKRINKNEKEGTLKPEDNELISNFLNGIGVIDRGTTVPKGLRRIPFHFKKETTDEKAGRVKDQLKIDMQPVFTPAGALSQGFPPVAPLKAGKRNSSEPCTSDNNHHFLSTEKGRIRVGVNFQAELPGEPQVPLKEYKEREDKEEHFWKVLKIDEDRTVGDFITLDDSKDSIYFHNMLRNVYWRAIWRQFESHIPFETALKHLMENNWDFAKSLDTIDQTLKDLPQVFKHPCVAQLKMFSHLLKDKKTTRRQLQDKAMRNYYIGEVQQFHYRYRRFYKYQEKFGVVCNCGEEMCKDIEFEPRYGCTNCTKSLRMPPDENPESEGSEHKRKQKLCLICITYQKLTGTMRSANNVIFSEDEILKIQQWNQKEKELGMSLTRQQFEDILNQENTERWKKNEVSVEENSMLNFKELKVPNRKHKTQLTEQEKEARGEKIAAQLQPFVLPHFTKCNCNKMGRIPWRSPDEHKFRFTDKEVAMYIHQLSLCKGNIHKVARRLKVQPELVRRFINLFASEYNLEQYFPNNCLPSPVPNIQYVPPSNLPPAIPDTANNSRDGSPYVPPEEARKKKK